MAEGASQHVLKGTVGPKQAAELLETSEKGVLAWISRGDSIRQEIDHNLDVRSACLTALEAVGAEEDR